MDFPEALQVCAEAAVRDYPMSSAHAQYEHDQLEALTDYTDCTATRRLQPFTHNGEETEK